MKIITDIKKEEPAIRKSINAYGCLAQHQFELFLNYGTKNETCTFLDFADQKGIMGYQNNTTWKILNDPLCKEDEKLSIVKEAVDFIFKEQKAKKIIMEDITEDLRKKIQDGLKDKDISVLRPSYSLFWPLVDLKSFSEDMPGKEWKKFRKFKNKFFRENTVVFKGIKEVDKKELSDLITRWIENRHDNDRVHSIQYFKFVENNFEGFDLLRIMEVNGKICSVYGGWKIPNSKNYYSFLGIHDYSVRDIGEVSYLDELVEVKKMGCEFLDLGGIEKEHLGFKMKFHPAQIYRTDTFSIMNRGV